MSVVGFMGLCCMILLACAAGCPSQEDTVQLLDAHLRGAQLEELVQHTVYRTGPFLEPVVDHVQLTVVRSEIAPGSGMYRTVTAWPRSLPPPPAAWSACRITPGGAVGIDGTAGAVRLIASFDEQGSPRLALRPGLADLHAYSGDGRWVVFGRPGTHQAMIGDLDGIDVPHLFTLPSPVPPFERTEPPPVVGDGRCIATNLAVADDGKTVAIADAQGYTLVRADGSSLQIATTSGTAGTTALRWALMPDDIHILELVEEGPQARICVRGDDLPMHPMTRSIALPLPDVPALQLPDDPPRDWDGIAQWIRQGRLLCHLLLADARQVMILLHSDLNGHSCQTALLVSLQRGICLSVALPNPVSDVR